MRLHHVAFGTFCFSLFGCGGSAPLTPQNPMKTVTNTSACTGAPTTGATIIGTWNAQMADTVGDSEAINMDFEANTLTLKVTCQYATGVTIPAQVTAAIQFDANNQIFVATTQQYSAPPQIDSTGVSRSCNATINQGTMTYSLVGPCLALEEAGDTTPTYFVK